MDSDYTRTSNAAPSGITYLLSRKVSAIQLVPKGEDGIGRLGLITDLPAGAQITVCGDGFNERTVKISCNGSTYFVFRQDLLPMQARSAGTPS